MRAGYETHISGRAPNFGTIYEMVRSLNRPQEVLEALKILEIPPDCALEIRHIQ